VNAAADDRAAPAAWPWRLAFLAYAAALVAGTHWPRLEIGTAAHPTDKIIHTLAFAGLTILLARTGWIRRLSTLALLMLLWAVVDELTQSIPGLGRSVSWKDVAAGYLGILVAVAWLWALRPVGGRVNRLRLAQRRFAFELVFSRIGGWAAAAAATVPLVMLLMMWSRLVEDWPPTARKSAMLIAMAIALLCGVSLLWRRWGRALRECGFSGPRPCFACGKSCSDLAIDGTGAGRCGGCGRAVHLAQWLDPSRLRRGALSRILRPRQTISIRRQSYLLFFAAVLLAGGAMTLRFGPDLAGGDGATPSRALPGDLIVSMLFSAVALFAAALAHEARRAIAQLYDDPVECRACGYDLRATETTHGVGRCGECGATFARSAAMQTAS
jgi:VanZ family protein